MKLLVVLFGLLLLTTSSPSWGQARSAAQTASTYACPMHADVTATQPGNCSRCGMALKPLAAAISDEFIVKLETLPQRIQVGAKLTLRFTVFHPQTGAQVKQFEILHEKPFHLFLIRHDFSHFAHLHPTPQSDGSFTLETVLPQAGMYHVFSDLAPAGGSAQTIHQTLVTNGFQGNAAMLAAPLQPDQALTKTVEGLRVALDFAPETPIAGQPTLLRYKLTDEQTGQPVTDLQPYLGAWGHTVILSDDATEYLHSHPLEAHDSTNVSRAAPNPATIYFATLFPRPGTYRIWTQFQRGPRLITVSFDMKVKSE